MSDPTPDLEPEHPQDEGLDAPEPGRGDQEGVHLLASQARERLEDEGFTDEQVYEWAAAYLAEADAGTVDGLVRWIREREST